MVKFCPTCGKQLPFENAEICPNCGVRINAPTISPPRKKEGSKIGLYLIIGIVLIFGVIVFAAVLSYVVLGAGYVATQTPQETVNKGGTQETVYKGVEQAAANIQMIGNVYGISSNTVNGIDEVKFSIGLAPGSPAIDLTKMKIVFSTSNSVPIILTQGKTAGTSIFTTELNGASAVNSISANEQVEISFKTSPLKPNTKLSIELRPSVGAALPFSKTTPATISTTNVLY
jgi:flagellin FlaB